MFFLQMSGYPGSGKSTLARAISQKLGAIIIDHDIVKSSLLKSFNAEIDFGKAGQIAYDMDWSLADFHLSQEQCVILDSPCLYTELLEKGTRLSEKYHANYKYIECFLSDNRERDLRLKTRKGMISQVSEVPPEVKDVIMTVETSKMKRPAQVNYLIVDTSQPLDQYMDEVMAYMNM